ncbi:TPA: recombinase RecT [Salmonella enterica subsp. enterica serovar Inverness]|nr:recombinase RecT [Salmonella enterica]HBL9887001.1 recombinase RecT [Salmonella enterica subsp. enterica serovar Inverness]EBA0689056.1 recombinase RecT [Salmonella enterica]EBB5155668.1 recombinase RecT [Salmonella enterica]EDY2903659.1 recombinase RecT [Salmonella enterica]
MCVALKRCAYRHKGKIMENTNIVTTEQQAPNTISASNAIFNVQALGQLTAFANLMADSQVTVPAHLAGKPADCMAIVMQAMQWGMNPYAVAQKTHLVNGVLGYEAQLVNAVIASSSAIHGRFHYRYGGDWERCTRTQEITRDKNGKNGKYTVTERVRGWTDEDEIGLFVQVGAILRGESEITWGEPLYLSGVVTRNSPLWVSNPKQQIAYLGVKYWARLYCPEVILGVYSPDEIEEREEKIINPVQNAQKITMQDITADTPQTSSTQIAGADTDAVADEFRTRINSAETLEDATAVGNDINSAKPTLGTALFTELKNKATRRYHLVKHRNLVETAINAIPRPGEPESVAGFEAAEKVLTAAKRHIGDELYDKYRITLDDMKPEYIG